MSEHYVRKSYEWEIKYGDKLLGTPSSSYKYVALPLLDITRPIKNLAFGVRFPVLIRNIHDKRKKIANNSEQAPITDLKLGNEEHMELRYAEDNPALPLTVFTYQGMLNKDLYKQHDILWIHMGNQPFFLARKGTVSHQERYDLNTGGAALYKPDRSHFKAGPFARDKTFCNIQAHEGFVLENDLDDSISMQSFKIQSDEDVGQQLDWQYTLHNFCNQGLTNVGQKLYLIVHKGILPFFSAYTRRYPPLNDGDLYHPVTQYRVDETKLLDAAWEHVRFGLRVTFLEQQYFSDIKNNFNN